MRHVGEGAKDSIGDLVKKLMDGLGGSSDVVRAALSMLSSDGAAWDGWCERFVGNVADTVHAGMRSVAVCDRASGHRDPHSIGISDPMVTWTSMGRNPDRASQRGRGVSESSISRGSAHRRGGRRFSLRMVVG
jgi:hypothetical protein